MRNTISTISAILHCWCCEVNLRYNTSLCHKVLCLFIFIWVCSHKKITKLNYSCTSRKVLTVINSIKLQKHMPLKKQKTQEELDLNMNKMSISPSRLPTLKKNQHWTGALLRYQRSQAFMEADAFPSHSSPACNYLKIQYNFYLKNWTVFMKFNFFFISSQFDA